MKILVVSLLCVAVAQCATAFVCPQDRRGYLRDDEQCDKFYDCHRGNGEPFLCPDGLVFDDYEEICDYEFNSGPCPENSYFQTPTNSTKQCPRLNGFFEHEDPTKCSSYYWCVEGQSTEFKCPNDNHFDEFSGSCMYPTESHRKNCVKEIIKHPDGYECHPKTVQFQNGHRLVHTLHPDPYDCQSFYTCFNGKTPQKASCSGGLLFNVDTLTCDDPANIADLETNCPEYSVV